MKKEIKYGLALLFLMLLCAMPLGVKAAYPAAFSISHPITGYPLTRTKDVMIYKDANRKEKLTSVSYRVFNITKYDSETKSFYVFCKSGTKTVHGWVKRNTFLFTQEYKPVQSFANQNMVLYKGKSTALYYKDVPMYTGGATIGESGSWYQMVFYMNKRYYLGWVPKDSYGKVRLSMDTTEQPLADGIYTIAARKKAGFALTADPVKGTARLTKSSGKNNQLFTLTYTDGQYMIQPYGENSYLGIKNGKLALTDVAVKWTFTRYGRYFALKEMESGKGISFASGKGILEKRFARTDASQDWVFTKATVKDEEEKITVFSQYDPKWGGNTYCPGNPVRTLASSGCGVVSFVNAIYALNGEYIDPTMLGEYSNSHGHYIYMQGTADTLYQDFARTNGKYYHFKWDGKVVDMGSLRNHLKKGGTAVALVPGHYIAIVGYREKDNSYLVLDSAVYTKRPTTITGDWLSESTLRSGSMYCYYFHLFSRI